MKTLGACILLVLVTAAPAAGQTPADSAARTITIPAPENGIIYIRSGTPGGVRIRSRRVRAPARTPAAPPASADLEEPARMVDLDRLARVFDRQGLDLYGETVRVGDRVVVVLRDSTTGAAADTLSPAEAEALVESFGPPADDAVDDAAPDSVRIARIERTILDVGLLRSLEVNFEFDRSELLPSATPTLDAVSEVLKRNPALRIEIAGHTDAVGTMAYNEALSERRAASVREYLLRTGVDRARLTAVGYGEARPLLSNATPTGRALNRRVEFRVLDGSDR